MSPMLDANGVRERLRKSAPDLCDEIGAFVAPLVAPLLERLNGGRERAFPKTFNDPIWGAITLFPHEVLLLDCPLLQRLREVKQLGLAHFVYPGASHGRLEHSRGVVEASQRMIDSLARNALHHRKYGTAVDQAIPEPSEQDILATRLAGLLHDIGHGPFSHATEPLIRERHAQPLKALENAILESFDGATSVAPGEIVALLVVMSQPLQKVFEHASFGVASPELAPAIAGRIVGSRAFLSATYLSGVISGPIDADKLDYMARDCHHSGLPLGLDINRLINKLEVVTITPENAPNDAMKRRAESASGKRLYDIGISVAALGAYEQMIIARAILYDRLYYHHKVRAAEAMARALIRVHEQEAAIPMRLSDMFGELADEAMIAMLSGQFKASTDSPASQLGIALRRRDLYYRAYAFAARFIDGLDGLPEADQRDTRADKWTRLLSELGNEEGLAKLAVEICEKAKQIAALDKSYSADGLQAHHVLVDLPRNKAVVRGGDILTRYETGYLGTPNLFFDPEKWSQAYETQKQCGYVFAPRKFAALINIAAKIVFCDRFTIVLSDASDHVAKVGRLTERKVIETLASSGVCSAEAVRAFRDRERKLVTLAIGDLQIPDDWKTEDPQLVEKIVDDFNSAITGGLTASMLTDVAGAIGHLVSFAAMAEKDGMFVRLSDLPEKDLQRALARHLRSRMVDVKEGDEVGGGETDLILPGGLVIENKVRAETVDPHEVGKNYEWQARRYSIAVSRRVLFTVLGYKPKNEAAILPLTQRIRVIDRPMEGFAQIRLVVPWGHPLPHDAVAPK
jgi:HD superfamily phosphohydrolase